MTEQSADVLQTVVAPSVSNAFYNQGYYHLSGPVVRAVVAQMETVPGGVPADALAAVRRVRAELTAFEAADGARAPLLRSAGERFVQYSAAILRT